jgi:alanine-glyoxylate transaminase/serine-glyoxylate transaminase/serine-pyruvate transaminase
VDFDAIDIDFAYSATQKCLGSPPGMSPVAIGPRALEVIKNRKEKPRTWYLDLGLLLQYWAGGTRVYHHTAPMSMIYALRESLRLVLQEGLEVRFARHRKNGRALRAGLEALGLKLLVPEDRCTYQLTSVFIPDGIEDGPLRRRLLDEYHIEVGGGLGQFGGSMWRIGLMGESSTASNVLTLLSALETLLPESGFEVAGGAGVSAASQSLAAD